MEGCSLVNLSSPVFAVICTKNVFVLQSYYLHSEGGLSVLSVGNDLFLVSLGTLVPPGLWTCDDSVFCNMAWPGLTAHCHQSQGDGLVTGVSPSPPLLDCH